MKNKQLNETFEKIPAELAGNLVTLFCGTKSLKTGC